MDPVTHAANVFLEEAQEFWKDDPGRVLPLIATPSVRDDVVKALRLAEREPENRWPLFLYEEPFEQPDAYFRGLASAITKDYQALRTGVADEGAVLPELAPIEPSTEPMAQAAFVWQQVAERLGDRFAGALVALLPAQVADSAQWNATVGVLAGLPRTPRMRLAIFAPPGGPLDDVVGDEGAHFHVDPVELTDFLSQAEEPPSAGGANEEAPVVAGVKLRSLLLKAAEATNMGNMEAAAETFETARSVCAAGGLVLEEAMVLMSLAGAGLAIQRQDLALESYEKATRIAHEQGAKELECSALLGIAGVQLAEQKYGPAMLAYRAAANAARKADLTILRIEALRLGGTCLLYEGSETAALAFWQEALGVGTPLNAGERVATTFAEVARALADLLKHLRLYDSAAHVESLLAAREAPKELSDTGNDVPPAPVEPEGCAPGETV